MFSSFQGFGRHCLIPPVSLSHTHTQSEKRALKPSRVQTRRAPSRVIYASGKHKHAAALYLCSSLRLTAAPLFIRTENVTLCVCTYAVNVYNKSEASPDGLSPFIGRTLACSTSASAMSEAAAAANRFHYRQGCRVEPVHNTAPHRRR